LSIGERIKKARIFRGMTQKELGIAVGFNEKNADVRIAQYESNTRRPKDNLLYKMADVLDVGFFALYEPRQYNAESIMYSLFDQGNDPMRVQLEEVLTTDGLQHPQKRIAIIYNYDHLDEYLREWKLRREQVLNHTITVKEYTEWVVNWPDTSDVFVEEPNYRDWKKTKE
jgi:transcriptional regulator with XRE-family HTH domain